VAGKKAVMALVTTPNAELYGTEDFAIESADGRIGRVEEVWLGPDDEPEALAIRMVDGGRALLLSEEVRTVDREYRWIVVRREPALLELDAPRLIPADGDSRLVALWETTGARITPRPPSRLEWLLRGAAPTKRLRRGERPLWRAVAILYGSIALAAILLIALAFLIPLFVTGSAY
jgi:hypothetical protein